MTVFDIRPFDGVGPLKFGMSPDEVHNLLGTPRMQTTNPIGQRDERYPDLRVRYDAESRLMCELSFSTPHDVRFAGIALFNDPSSISRLALEDGHALEGLGFIVFPKLGIALADFDSDQESDRAITAFAKGRWADLENFKPLALT